MDNNSLIVSNGAKEKEVRELMEVELVKSHSHFLEEFDLTGIEVIDLKVNTIAEISQKVAEDKSAKILAIEARNKAEILAAIAAGASGVLSENIISEDGELALQAFKQGLILVDNREVNVCNFAIVPRELIESKFEHLQRELATALIDCWRKKPLPENLILEPIEEKLAISDLVKAISKDLEKLSFEKELKIKSEKSQKNRPQTIEADLNSIATKYQKSYFDQKLHRTSHIPNSAVMKIRLNAHELKECLANEIADSFFLCIKFGSIAVEQFFKGIMLKLQKHEIHWENQHQIARDKSRQYYFSYYNLAAKVATKKSQKDFESALRALNLFYEELIRAEVYRSISCLIFELIRELNLYHERAIKCDRFLQEIGEEWGDLSHSVKIDPALQSRFFLLRNELESRFGSVFDWYDLPNMKNLISNKILESSRIWALELMLEQY